MSYLKLNQNQQNQKNGFNRVFEKTKLVLTKIYNSYSQGYMNRVLTDEEYPEESICDKCTGCGLFIDSGEKKNVSNIWKMDIVTIDFVIMNK